MTAEDDRSGGSVEKLSEDNGRCGSTYYNRVFSGRVEVMRIILPLLTVMARAELYRVSGTIVEDIGNNGSDGGIGGSMSEAGQER